MRNPTPVTTRAMTAASSSKRKVIEVENVPAAIQPRRVLAKPGPGPAAASRTRPATDRMRERKTASDAWTGTHLRGSRPPISKSTAALAPGRRGMSQNRSAMLSLEVLEIVGPDGLPAPEDENDDGQADHGLGRRHRDDEQDDGLTVGPDGGPAQSQKSEIAGVEHDLHGHELRQEVLLDKKGDDPQNEEQGGQREEGPRRDHSPSFRPARARAPTRAARIRSEVISNA